MSHYYFILIPTKRGHNLFINMGSTYNVSLLFHCSSLLLSINTSWFRDEYLFLSLSLVCMSLHAFPSTVKSPLEENEMVGITNYIDFGFELQTSIDDEKSLNNIQESTFQVAASWQANKNFLLKGNSSIALAFKSWWKPSFIFSMSEIGQNEGHHLDLVFVSITLGK
ncbi:uncharacterized protein LOC111400839 isoform X1 [Olea europaea var. sylvestris]|uniref:uncharacterized protein LOC111400839 isoform X1 n=1 Tax=Olea europaea var. sylvestris TaxID=158386 RepID=UPI000C1CF7CB|nr:uncharacterized protein LOC111400839 isoform X1 [Olea europaea var. sylvestris]